MKAARQLKKKAKQNEWMWERDREKDGKREDEKGTSKSETMKEIERELDKLYFGKDSSRVCTISRCIYVIEIKYKGENQKTMKKVKCIE